MFSSRGQSGLEWLMTHAWAIMVVLSVSAVLFYSGVFEATARPRFEGLASSSVQPVPEQVKLYSDGVLVFTVLNTRPYPIRLEWVEVAPIADKDDVVRTVFGTDITSGDIGVFNVNASNLVSVFGASFLFFPDASAKNQFVDFIICWNESYSAGGSMRSHVICGKASNIAYISEPYAGGGGASSTCFEPLGYCPCEEHTDCPLTNCASGCVGGSCEDFCFLNPDFTCGPLPDPLCSYCACVPTAGEPLGECKLFWHSDC